MEGSQGGISHSAAPTGCSHCSGLLLLQLVPFQIIPIQPIPIQLVQSSSGTGPTNFLIVLVFAWAQIIFLSQLCQSREHRSHSPGSPQDANH